MTSLISGTGAPAAAPEIASKGSTSSVGLYIGIGAGILVILQVMSCFDFACRCWNKPEKRIPFRDQTMSEVIGKREFIIPYYTLAQATDELEPTNQIGEGRFGAVYRGVLPDGTEVAVRRLSLNSRQGKREFVQGVKEVMDLNHRNVVGLMGCCYENTRLLAYEYIENGSLAASLFDRRKNMDWKKRWGVVLGIAEGLAYLHEESQTIYAHGDIKAGNILLDRTMNPKIADFGLANLFRNDQGEVKPRNMTSVGYMSPELALDGQLTAKADVFAFGILCLEIVCGRLNTDINSLGTDQQHLLSWAWQLQEKRRVLDMVDNRMDDYQEEQVLKVINIALVSTQDSPSSRPSMSRVLAMLKNEERVPKLPSKPESVQSLGLGQQNMSGTFSSSFVAPRRPGASKRWGSRRHQQPTTAKDVYGDLYHSGIYGVYR